jgi:hypothetical protein
MRGDKGSGCVCVNLESRATLFVDLAQHNRSSSSSWCANFPQHTTFQRTIHTSICKDAAEYLWKPSSCYIATSPSPGSSACFYRSTATITTSRTSTTANAELWKPIPGTSSSRGTERLWRIWRVHERSYSANGISGRAVGIEAWNRIRGAKCQYAVL